MPRNQLDHLEKHVAGLRGDMDRLVQVVAAQQEMVIECRREWHILAEAIAETNRDQAPDAADLLAGLLST